jgi:hypothetical protein
MTMGAKKVVTRGRRSKKKGRAEKEALFFVARCGV